MEEIAIANNFEPHDVLLGPDATYARVTAKIRNAAAQLERDDFFFFSFAGHGFQRVDTRGDRDEGDRLDETILLFDVELFDDVLRKDLWPRFAAGVRVLMVSDSCHSGSVFLKPLNAETRISNLEAMVAPEELIPADEFPVLTPERLVARTIANSTAFRHRAEHRQFYENILLPLVSPPINASVLLLAACEDDGRTGDGLPHGVYTAALLDALTSNPVDYDNLVNQIQQRLDAAGRTQRAVIRAADPDDVTLRRQRPFRIQ
jgi:hypothetical protein